jgi:hypothetical protein
MIRILAMLILSLVMKAAVSQTTLNFCTSVDRDYCYFNNTKFISPIDSTQALIFLLVKNPTGFNTSNLKFNIYTLDKTGKETLKNTLEQPVEHNWDWAWKSDLFKSPGKYKVKIYDQNNNSLAEKTFELILP